MLNDITMSHIITLMEFWENKINHRLFSYLSPLGYELIYQIQVLAQLINQLHIKKDSKPKFQAFSYYHAVDGT